MTDSQSRFATMPARQKASVIIFFLIGAFILYEVIGYIRGSGSSSSLIKPLSSSSTQESAQVPAPTPAPKMSAQSGMKMSNPSGGSNATPPQAPAAGPAAPQLPPTAQQMPATGPQTSPQTAKPRLDPVLPQTELLAQQNAAQNDYVSALNDLQMRKIQREIAETNQAIQAATLATVTAEKSIKDMLAPELNNPPPPVPSQQAAMPAMSEMAHGGSYVVQSVTMALDQWHAVLSYKGKLFDVSVGDLLPTDGSTVVAIDQKGVTIELGDMKQVIPLTSTDNVYSTGSASTIPGEAATPANSTAAP